MAPLRPPHPFKSTATAASFKPVAKKSIVYNFIHFYVVLILECCFIVANIRLLKKKFEDFRKFPEIFEKSNQKSRVYAGYGRPWTIKL